MRPIAYMLGFFGLMLIAVIVLMGVTRRSAAQAQRLAYRNGGAVSDLVVVHADGGQARVLVQNANLRETVKWSPDGAWLATIQYVNQGRNIVRISTIGTTNQVLTHRRDNQYDYGSPNWSPDSVRLMATYGFIYQNIQGDVTPQFGLHLVEGDGSSEQSVTQVRDRASVPVWSPDGKWIAYVSRFGGLPSIMRIRPDGSGREQLTDEALAADDPVWSPDGEWIAFYVRNVIADDEVRIMRSDGSEQQILYQFRGASGFRSSIITWSPDGKRLAFQADTNEGFKFLVADLNGDQVQVILDEAVDGADWSPDGQWIAFSADNGQTSQIYRVRPDGSGREQLTWGLHGAHYPEYAPLIDKTWGGGWLALLTTIGSGLFYVALSSVSVFSKFAVIMGSSISSS